MVIVDVNQLGDLLHAWRAAGTPDIECGPFAFADVFVEIVSISIHAFEQNIGCGKGRLRG